MKEYKTNMKEKNKSKKKSIYMKKKQSHIKITREMRDIIHGYLMSDGFVNKYGIITIEQSIEQTKFVQWLYESLAPICKQNKSELNDLDLNNAIKLVTRIDKRSGKLTSSKRFWTRSVCKGFHHMWYKPETIQNPKNNGNVIFKKKIT